MTLTISKSHNLTKDPEQNPNPYLRPLRVKKKKSNKDQNNFTTNEDVIVNLSHQQPRTEKNDYIFTQTKKKKNKL